MNTFKLSILSLAVAASATATTVSASVIDFGDASHYNVFVKEDFSATSSDVEGRLAAGGNVDISNYSVNIKGGSQNHMDTSTYPALVANGDLSYSSGNIAGNVYVGGNYLGSSSGTISNGTLTQGGTSPIDFTSTFDTLTTLSNDLSMLSANSTASDLWGTQYLTGAGNNGSAGDLHVFSLDASDMSYYDYLLSDVDAGDTIIFNVAGTTISTSSGNFGGSDFGLSSMANHILYNFYEAEVLDINAVMFGSILAPTADIYTDWGLIEGQVFANSWSGNAQVNDKAFIPPEVTISVSEPSSFALFGLAAGLLFALRRRRA